MSTRRTLLLASTALAAACADGPTAPRALGCPTARVPLCTDAARAAAVRAALDDASTRLVPTLANATARAGLAGRLPVLAARLDAGDVAGARTALATARAALAGEAADAPDLAAIQLTLAEIASALGDA